MIARGRGRGTAQHTGMAGARQAILQSLPTLDLRDATADFLDLWHSSRGQRGGRGGRRGPGDGSQERTSITGTRRRSRSSGPARNPAETRFRQTEQAILEVVNSATRRLTVVSYAVYRIPRIREALVAAANRGVGIRLIVETPNRIEGQKTIGLLLALGDNVASACSRLLLAPGEPAQGRQRQDRHPARQVRRGRWTTGCSCRAPTSPSTPSPSTWSWGY